MTTTKAIEIVKSFHFCGNCTTSTATAYESCKDCPQYQVKQIILEALKKQIPQECNTKVTNNGIDISGEYDFDNHYLCPDCENVVGDFEAEEHYYDYCPNCGQKLDWSEE